MPAAIAAAVVTFVTSLGATAAVASFIGAVASFAVTSAISVGLSVGVGLLFGKKSVTAASVKPSDGQQNIRQPVPSRWKSYGKVRVSGPVWWFDVNSANGQFFLGLALNQGRIGGFVSYHIDDLTVTLDGSGNVTTSPYSGTTTKILTRLGEDTETAYSEITSAFSVADVRGDRVATMLGIFDNFSTAELQQQNYPNGQPRLRATINASVVWDPRDPAQSRTDRSTWQWSENPIVCLLDYMLDPDGFSIPWARIEGNIAEWIAAMDICDEETLTNTGGYEARYRIAGSFLFTDKPDDIVARILMTCDGRRWQKRDGSVGISVGRYVKPTVHLTDDHITGYDMVRGQDPLKAVGGIRAQYMSPENDYREQDAEPWPDGETVMSLTEDRVATLDLLMVPSHGQARRLMKREAVRAAAPWRGTITTNLAGLRAIDERFILVTITELGIFEQSFEVGRFGLAMSGEPRATIELLAIGAEIDEFEAAVEEGEPAGLTIYDAWTHTNEFETASGVDGWSIRQIVYGPEVTAAGAQVRISIMAGPSTPLVMKHVSISTSSAPLTNSDADDVPTEVLFNGLSGFTLAAGETILSDWLDYPIAAGTSYIVAMDILTGRISLGVDAVAYFKNPGESYNQQTVTGFSQTFNSYGVTKVEVRG